MTFSDEDLKRIKDGLAGPDDAWFDGYTVKTITALIARLEAAEKIAERYLGSSYESVELIKAWRKAAGKSEKENP